MTILNVVNKIIVKNHTNALMSRHQLCDSIKKSDLKLNLHSTSVYSIKVIVAACDDTTFIIMLYNSSRPSRCKCKLVIECQWQAIINFNIRD